jgi:hypothetical protein
VQLPTIDIVHAQQISMAARDGGMIPMRDLAYKEVLPERSFPKDYPPNPPQNRYWRAQEDSGGCKRKAEGQSFEVGTA